MPRFVALHIKFYAKIPVENLTNLIVPPVLILELTSCILLCVFQNYLFVNYLPKGARFKRHATAVLRWLDWSTTWSQTLNLT